MVAESKPDLESRCEGEDTRAIMVAQSKPDLDHVVRVRNTCNNGSSE